MNNNSILKLVIIFLVYLILLVTSHYLFAQDFFPCGVYNFDVTGPEYRFSSQEFQHIKDINASWVSSVSLKAQGGMIDSFSALSESIKKMTLERDSLAIVHGHYYPLNPGTPDEFLNNTVLWVYLCNNNFVTDIDSAHIDSFVTHADLLYNGRSGLGGILVAHEGNMDRRDRWPFIKHACTLVQNSFDDDVKSIAVHNIFHWRGGTTLQQFFQYMNNLDVYQHEQYPLRMFNQTNPPYTPAPHIGNDFQQAIDTLVMSYQQTWEALKNSDNNHTKLEFIFQTMECYNEQYHVYWRQPTQAEIWLQAFLALSRAAKGIHCYVYRSNHWGGATYETGLIDSTTRNPNQPTYDYVADLYAHLDSLGQKLLPLTADTAFTWTGTVPLDYPLIQEITGYALDGTHPTIEVCLMNDPDPANAYDYFMLINRRCSRDNNGTPAAPQIISVQTNKTGPYQIRDLYSGEVFVSIDGSFRNITIDPGRGRVFELRR